MLSGTDLIIPRGLPDLAPIRLEMQTIYSAEGRLSETKMVNSVTAVELMASFNEASNITSKYLSWVEYEILQAKKTLDLAKATVILDKMPAEAIRLKDSGIKMNEDHRSAMITRDADCQKSLDILNGLEAVKAYLTAKNRTFERGYYLCRDAMTKKGITLPMNGYEGMTTAPQSNFMGQDQRTSVDEDVIKMFRDGK
jgi:hypothetical protein